MGTVVGARVGVVVLVVEVFIVVGAYQAAVEDVVDVGDEVGAVVGTVVGARVGVVVLVVGVVIVVGAYDDVDVVVVVM